MKDEHSRPPHADDHLPNGDDHRDPAPEPAAAEGSMLCIVCSTVYAADMRFCPSDGSILRPVVDGRSDLIGVVIDGRYYLTRKLGQGGMGDVYLGEHVRTQRLCAVKVVSRRQAGDPEALGRFLREATNAGRISHPHVATVYDFGETDDGMFYLAMEYVDGEPLSRLIELEGALPPARAVEIARQVAEGVAAAHEFGIVHRDLKPGNILIARDRKGSDLVKVVDFGIARAPADEQQNLTRTGMIIGTPEYMSPEQLIGDPVDGRSDIYSLGCILYQMLTGEQAFGGPTAQVITRRLTEPPPRPREKNPAIPKPLDDLIVTALARTPQERFQTMEAVRNALLAAPSQAPATGPQRLTAWLGTPTTRTAPTPAVAADAAERSGDDDAAASAVEAPAAAEPLYPVVSGGLADPADPFLPDESSADVLGVPDSMLFPAAQVDATNAQAADADDVQSEPGAAIGTSRRRLPLRAGILAASVILLVSVLALIRGNGRMAAVALPADTAIVEAPVVVSVPDPVLIAEIYAQLSQAAQDELEDRYASVIPALQAMESRVVIMLTDFPDDPDVRILADSVHTQIETTRNRCNAVRVIKLGRNQPAPTCEMIEQDSTGAGMPAGDSAVSPIPPADRTP